MYCSCGQPWILTATVWHLHRAACYGTQLRAKGKRSSTRISPAGNNLDSPEAVWLLIRKTGPIPRSLGNVNHRFWSSAACAASFFPLLRCFFPLFLHRKYSPLFRNSGSPGLPFSTKRWIKGEQPPLPPLLKQIVAKKSQTTERNSTCRKYVFFNSILQATWRTKLFPQHPSSNLCWICKARTPDLQPSDFPLQAHGTGWK